MHRLLIFLCLSFLFTASFGQVQVKQLEAKRTSASIKIDGTLDEPAWKDAPAALGFTEFRPTPFKKEDSASRTEIYMLYNDEGIYIGGYCHERTKDSISAELNGRDGFGNNDFISIVFDTYTDKINGFEYFVTPFGEQMDAKVSPNTNGNNEEFSWNAVWKSAAKIHDDGWSFEIFLPFSAIRFSKKPIQDWGMNITRRRQKTGQQVAWNPIDVNVNGYLTQSGIWKGLENIRPPLRLQFSPYLSVYANHYPYNQLGIKNWTSSVNGGMDVKYGISQALTLDMTLVPDFGQVQSDNQILNLSPFEVKFNENRSFFTEGTELFNKGNFFYSRRIGGTPLHYYDVQGQLNSNEHISSNPTETKLINATKISGRFRSGLGIGFFNAVTNAQYAIVEDNLGHQRKVQTNALTNYNIVVLNQSLKYNSSLSFINTSVFRGSPDYNANVAAVLFDFNDKRNMWNLGGKIATSSLFYTLSGGKRERGYSHNLYFGKTSGRFNFQVDQDLTDSKFNSNDLGYFTNNNFLNHSFNAGYRWVKPTHWYNNIFLNFNALYSARYVPLTYQAMNVNMNVNGQLKNLWQLGLGLGYEPETNNFYEARVPGRNFKGWSDWFISPSIETNSAKKYFVQARMLYVSRSFFKSKRTILDLQQNYRFSPKFSMGLNSNFQPQSDNVGFATINGNDIIFGKRDISQVENTMNFKYSFNDRMVFTTRVRHYWSKVMYKEYFTLQQDGRLGNNSTFTGNADENYNSFTIDADYNWQFAPGSFLNVVWKNNATTFDFISSYGYFKNFNNVIASPQNNNISVKVIYFLDYMTLRNSKKKAEPVKVSG